MGRRKNGMPRTGYISARDFHEHGTSRWTSSECKDNLHDECDEDGGCSGCSCHFDQD